MKCTNCGKNNAVSHYRYEINGEITEAHLCAECARELRPEREFAARSRELFGDMGSFFDTPLTGGGLLRSFFGGDPFEGFFGGPLSLFGAPRIEISFPDAGESAERQESAAQSLVDPELSKRREINALREQMRAAAESEDYETAARLRDKLREMEKKDE